LFLPEEPGRGATANFEFLWEEMDRHYSFFDLKGIDWKEIGDHYRPGIRADMSPEDLFNVLSLMLAELRDGHVGLQAPFATYRYSGWYQPYRHNFDFGVVWARYLDSPRATPSRMIFYGWVTPEIGYLHLPTFNDTGWTGEIDEVLETFAGARGVVVDVRDNSGGKDANAEKIAGRFTSERRLYRRIQYRNGPEHGDFSPLEDDYLEPRGRTRFLGPVALLTNRRTFSAGESFVLAMSTLPGVTTVGDTTGGGSGNPLHREMPNGWSFSVSRWIEWSLNGTTHEGVGFPPDIPKTIPSQLLGFSDPILQAAIAHLERDGA
ncbi:MAG: S41 family peptidase, partial [Longimicrobiales bacterium]